MEKKYKVIIFCQSPRDLSKVVSLYELHKNDEVQIFVVNVYGNYLFLKNLNLQAKLEFIPHKKIKKPIHFIFMFFYLNFKVIPQIKSYQDEKVYFFSQYFDYVTGILIKALSKKNQINFIDNYKQNLKEISPTFFEKIFLFGFNLAFQTKLFYAKVGSFRAYFFKLPSNTILIECPTNIPETYKQSYGNKSDKNILIFEGRGDQKDYFYHYEEDFEAVLATIPEDFIVYIKPHPRLNYSPFIDRFENIKIVDKNIPSEFLNPKNFKAIIGIESSATADFYETNTATYSLIPLFKFKEGSAEFYSKHLDNITDNKAVYIQNLQELNKKLSAL